MSELLEKHTYTQAGYRPRVFSDGWQVALLNWEPIAMLRGSSSKTVTLTWVIPSCAR